MIINLFTFLLGIVFGSFLTALTYRLPRGIGIVSGRSKCDSCGYVIRWFDNIPLLSYFLIAGRCRHCGKKISIRYPLIEIASGLFFVFIGLNFIWLAMFLILAAIFIIDLEHQLIPDDLIFAGLLLSFFIPGFSFFTSFTSGLVAASFLAIIFLLTSGRGMGLGDVKFAVLGGILVGIKYDFIWLLTAFLTGAICGLILIALKGAKLKDKIAFGPFLVIAIPITLLWGQKIIDLIGLSAR